MAHLQQLFYDREVVSWQLAERVFTQQVRVDDGYVIQKLAHSVYQNQDVLDDRLTELTTHTLIIQGNNDCLVPSPIGRRLHHEIRNSQLQIINYK